MTVRRGNVGVGSLHPLRSGQIGSGSRRLAPAIVGARRSFYLLIARGQRKKSQLESGAAIGVRLSKSFEPFVLVAARPDGFFSMARDFVFPLAVRRNTGVTV